MYGTGSMRLTVGGCAIRVEKANRKTAMESVGAVCC